MNEYQILHNWLDEDDVDIIKFECKDCTHTSEDHDEHGCHHGLISKCECKHFVLQKEQFENVKKELNEIGELMLKNYPEAKRLSEL